MSIIITLPNYDIETSYLSYYSQELIEFAETDGKTIISLKKPQLKKANFKKRVQTNNPSLIIINGHGNPDIIYGDKIDGKEEILITEKEDNTYLLGRVIFARACSAAASLGKKIADDDSCFIGFKVPFVFYANEEYITNPMKDKRAKLFLEPPNDLSKSLIKGRSPEQSVETFNNNCSKNLYRVLSNQKEPGSIALATALWNNMEAIVILGNESKNPS